ncbi:ABC transporter substrate-binding protein [Saccharopolyspora gloriosae]|uniref:ABC transporter substrate-binding protein n=1 Tax=Saccharopolyspora gloriosae TaxID=455344 RepID=UPI001FB66C48|nr:hypothetical protein [Saccharopolyspora gloriosae]
MSFETPPRPRWLLRVSLAVGTVLALALGVVVVVDVVYRCDTNVWSSDQGECVGVTDGSYAYDTKLEDVSEKILRANEEAERTPQSVTVAILMPMTANPGDSLSIEQIRDYLQGAHIAQLAQNQGGPGLKVRLALANEGRNEHAWEQVTDQLLDMVDVPGGDTSENLVAVTGLGLSAPETERGARKLSAAGVPMVGYLSADRFNSTYTENGPAIKGLARVSPSLDQELSAIAAHLDEQPDKPSTALLVHDENPYDYYTEDLRSNFKDEFDDILDNAGSSSAPYSGGPTAFGLDTQFGYIANRLCGPNAPRTVLYAGRSNLLPTFIEEVSRIGCPGDQPITVVTGSESTDLPHKSEAGRSPVSVLYASVSDRAALTDDRNVHKDRYHRFAAALHENFEKVRESNWSVMGHDATLTATEAAKRSVKGKPIVPTTGGVKANLFLLSHPRDSVPGVSGQFMLDADSGDRVSGPIPVLRRDEFGNTTAVDLGGLETAP